MIIFNPKIAMSYMICLLHQLVRALTWQSNNSHLDTVSLGTVKNLPCMLENLNQLHLTFRKFQMQMKNIINCTLYTNKLKYSKVAHF